MRAFHLLSAAIIAAPIAFAASTASAITFAGSVDGEFTSEDAQNTGVPPFFGTFGADISDDGKTLTWPGDTCVIFACGDPIVGQSSLTINDGGFSQDLTGGVNHVEIFSITWENDGTFGPTTDDLFEALAMFDIEYTSPDAASGSEEVSFEINNTNNPQGDIIDPSLSVAPLDFGLPLPTALGDKVEILGYSLMEVGDGAFGGGFWTNPEHGTSTLVVKAKVNVVPLPAAGWLLLAGVGGLAAMKRRKKA